MTRRIVEQITISRRFMDEAHFQLTGGSRFGLFAAALSAQDAVEQILILTREHLSVSVSVSAHFDQLFHAINSHLAEMPSAPLPRLPYYDSLSRLNRMRSNAKHHGVPPDAASLASAVEDARAFLSTVSDLIFNVNFWTASPIDDIRDDAIRGDLLSALDLMTHGKLYDGLVECAKAFYRAFLQRCDISRFGRSSTMPHGLLDFCEAPYYTQSAEWIAANVREPFDYVQVSRSDIEQKMIAGGVDVGTFWNIYNLLPKVYLENGSRWLVRTEFALVDDPELGANATYVLTNLTSILLRIQDNDRSRRSRTYSSSDIALKQGGVRVYERASRDSAFKTAPPELLVISADAVLEGLDGGYYVKVGHWMQPVDAKPLDIGAIFSGTYLYGYVAVEDLDIPEVDAGPAEPRLDMFDAGGATTPDGHETTS